MNYINKTISIIGAGRLGGALALALSECGYRIENLFVRSNNNAESVAGHLKHPVNIVSNGDYSIVRSDIILIATQESVISGVIETLAKELQTSPFVFHTSGTLSSQILDSLKNCCVGSIHPIVSVSDSLSGAGSFKGIYFGVEGEDKAVDIAYEMAKALGGFPIKIDTDLKPLYHAAAVTACGHLVALINSANEMLAKCGLDPAQTRNVLMPLIKSTIGNLEAQAASKALTGTFARLDTETFERHVAAMEGKLPDEVIEVYLQLGLLSVHLVNEDESNRQRRSELLDKISLAKRNLRC